MYITGRSQGVSLVCSTLRVYLYEIPQGSTLKKMPLVIAQIYYINIYIYNMMSFTVAVQRPLSSYYKYSTVKGTEDTGARISTPWSIGIQRTKDRTIPAPLPFCIGITNSGL
jgi:hypothetical protein